VSTPILNRLAGNAPLKDSIGRMRAGGRLGHSLLLCGEAGLGTGFAARCIAADLLYPTGGPAAEALLRGECCEACEDETVSTGIVREAIAVRPCGAADMIKVAQIRAMRSEIFNSSLSAAGRAVLIYHAERMNENAANALLKVLEEPPEGVTFLLTASSLAALLPTIRSRCISFAMAPVSSAECAAYCQKQGVPAADAAVWSKIYDGRIGTVLALSHNKTRRERLETAQQLAAAAAKRDTYKVNMLLAALGNAKDKSGVLQVLDDLCALCAASLREPKICPLTPPQAVRAVKAADAARAEMQANVNLKLVLTVLAIRLTK
jgi:DNA polymerase-3 subunit delta'